jgi:uncharacterized caspase-like protein
MVTVHPAAARISNETRVALVIGAGNYQTVGKLINPVNDARRIGEALRTLEFQVYEAFDPDHRSMAAALREFGNRAQEADVAIVFYAGHGMQVDHDNYLVPVDAHLESQRDLLYEALPLDLFTGEVARARKVGIIILDACRDNPFSERLARSVTVTARKVSLTKGLARVDNVPRNTLVAMATRADEIAEDGDGRNSPFTEALLAHFKIPGLELGLFFRSVRDTVLRATANRQEPYVFSSLGAEPFYFYPRPPELPPFAPIAVGIASEATPLRIPRLAEVGGGHLQVTVTGVPQSGDIITGSRAWAKAT